MNADRVVVVGWDCASPWLVFERFADAMPNLQGMVQRGYGGPLRSCDPPITVPAWMCMATGSSAGEHGVYGFRNVVSATGAQFALTDRHAFRGAPPVWDRLLARGMTSRVIGLPGTWPPASPRIVPGILTPHDHPTPTPNYRYDVADFRHMDPRALVLEVTRMTQARFDLVDDWADRDDWNLFWVVEIGLDRLYHALWHHVDPAHPRHDPDPELIGALRDYHALLDARLGRLLEHHDDGETAFVVVSDHGARAMRGGIRLNELFRRRGWLTLVAEPEGIEPFAATAVDWERTRAWTTGGYCARIYLEDDDAALAAEVTDAILSLPGPDGERLEHTVHRGSELWSAARGRAPDLVAYLGDLSYRCLGSVGDGPLHQESNDRGPDAANHDWNGILACGGAGTDGVAPPTRLLEVAGYLERLLGAG